MASSSEQSAGGQCHQKAGDGQTPAIDRLEGAKKDPKAVTEDEWRKVLSPEAFEVTRQSGTEAPFTGKFDKHFVAGGKYTCVCCGAALFVSEQKFNSGCGWPAFSKSIGDDQNIVRLPDNSYGRQRIEVRCAKCDAHLGHVFEMLLAAFRRIMFSQDLVAELLSKYSITKQRIVIDFSSPNIAKTFHMGHLRSTCYGDFMQRIFRHAGHEVVSLNYLGDWGHQFGLLTVYWMEVMDGMDGRMARPMADEWAAMSARKRVQLLTDAYVAANRLKLTNSAFDQKARQLQLNMERHMISTGAATVDDVDLAQIQTDDKLREAFGLWRDFRDSSVAYLEDFYARFGTKFDRWDAESYHVVEGARLTDEMIQSGLCRLTRDELWAVCQPEVGLGREKITLRKGDGLNLYMNRDLASIYARHRLYNADKYFYLVDYGQTNHFNQLRLLLRVRGDDDLADRMEHVSFGRIIGLSTRNGKNDSVDFLIDQGAREADAYVHASPTMRAEPAELGTICRRLAESTLLFEIVFRHRNSHFTFSFRNSFRPGGTNALLLHLPKCAHSVHFQP